VTGRERAGAPRRLLVLAPPYLWLALFFLAPFAIVLKIALAQFSESVPPFTPLIAHGGPLGLAIRVHLDNFAALAQDPLYAKALLGSLRIAAVWTLLCLLIGYPMAYAIARASARWRGILVLLVMLPFWTSFLIRVYAWKVILQGDGVINAALIGLGLIDRPLPLLYSPFAVHLGIVYSYLPFMVLPLYASLERMDLSLLEAAADLGARPWRAFLAVTLPLSLPGVLAGALLVFIPAVGEFVIPELLGGSDTLMIGSVLWNEFFLNRDWPRASAVAVGLLVVLLAPIVLFQRAEARAAGEGGP
jgi:putrescine transport system permease protein